MKKLTTEEKKDLLLYKAVADALKSMNFDMSVRSPQKGEFVICVKEAKA